MRRQQQWWSGLVATVLSGLVGVTAVAAGGAQFLAILGVREGAIRSKQIPIANGFIDYVTLLNVYGSIRARRLVNQWFGPSKGSDHFKQRREADGFSNT